MGHPPVDDSVRTLVTNFTQAPPLIWRSFWRHPSTRSARGRSDAITESLFLHVHSERVHRFSLKSTFTAGLGVATLSFFCLLIVTGLFLMIYYTPSTRLAFQATKDIHYVVPAGRSVRNIHRWAGHLMVLAAFLHMARVFYTGAYRAPREYNWVIGLALLVLTLGISVTGYLLPWDQLAFWAVTIGANIASSPTELTDALGLTQYVDPGRLVKLLLLGADEVGESSLVRFYFLHCFLLPGLLATLIAVHFWRIRKDGGLAVPADVVEAELPRVTKERRRARRRDVEAVRPDAALAGIGVADDRGRQPDYTVASWPHALRAELAVFMICTVIALACAYLWDAPLREAANPAVPENPAKAPWYFVGLQELAGYSAFVGGIVIPAVTLLGLGLIPYIDRRPGRTGRWFDGGSGLRAFWWSLVTSSVMSIGVLAFTIRYGWVRTWFPDVSQLVVIAFNPGTVLVAAFASLSLVTLHRTRSTRAAAIALFTAFLAGFTILTYFAMVHRGPNWGFYWTHASWPRL